jgi:hypothetical protein
VEEQDQEQQQGRAQSARDPVEEGALEGDPRGEEDERRRDEAPETARETSQG